MIASLECLEHRLHLATKRKSQAWNRAVAALPDELLSNVWMRAYLVRSDIERRLRVKHNHQLRQLRREGAIT